MGRSEVDPNFAWSHKGVTKSLGMAMDSPQRLSRVNVLTPVLIPGKFGVCNTFTLGNINDAPNDSMTRSQ
ncbi:hypothetical protein Y032_0055g2544 [Ancylostoma ceylanicum]|uniref:Uncharacterized protein n=1 Tax=Ancylostoma ceylanicum TaxID=53326 RepID=A0A016U639_9BILA|nr:hypothetical protein Y032_0055g2544 [Ancylostoma ceylanicum]